MEKHKMRKTTLYVIILAILSYSVMLALLITTGTILVRQAEKDVRDSLIKDHETIITNARHLYEFDIECLEYSINNLREAKKESGSLSTEQVQYVLKQNFDFFNQPHSSVILDVQAVYQTNYFSIAGDTLETNSQADTLLWVHKAQANPDRIVETSVYQHSVLTKKVFSYALYDSDLDIAVSLDIDCDRIIQYNSNSSIEDCFLSFINGEGEVIATNEESLLGVNTKDIQSGKLAGFSDYMDYIKENPNISMYDTKENNTFSFSYYYEEADRYIITVYYPSTDLYDSSIVLIFIFGGVLLVFSIALVFILKWLISWTRKLNEKIETEVEKKKQMTRLNYILNNIVEYRSYESGSHIRRVQQYTKRIAEELQARYPEYRLTDKKIDSIVLASSLHDVGKIAIPDNILNKPGRLTPEEFEIMKTHSAKGAEMIDRILDKNEDYFIFARNIALYHHERYDGRGYPCGLTGDEIPIEAQIVSVADVLDALVNKRCYKDAYGYDEAIQMILNNECGVLNPKLLEILRDLKDELYIIFEQNRKTN